VKALETFLAEGSRQRAEGRSKGEESINSIICYTKRKKAVFMLFYLIALFR
jgi:hypothetical protein